MANQTRDNKLFVLGSYNIDVITTVNQFPQNGQTVIGNKLMYSHGGKGSNQAVAAARLGANVQFVGAVGTDPYGNSAKEFLTEEKISIKALRTIDGHTGIAIILVDERTRDNRIIVNPGVNHLLQKSHVETLRFNKGDILLVQFEIPFHVIGAGVDKAFSEGAKVILNPAPAMKMLTNHPILKKVYMITPNETETEIMTGIKINTEADMRIATNKFFAMGVRTVVITMGEKGVFLASQENKDLVNGIRIEGRKVKVKDTTGAGDCFNGAIAAGLLNGLSLVDAAFYAVHASSLSVTKAGAAISMPYQNEMM